MAKYKSFIKIYGTLDGMTFYTTEDGDIVKMKSGVSGERIKKDPAFKGTRDNMDEFGAASSSGALLRKALKPVIASLTDGKLPSRVMQVMTKIKKCDLQAERSQRRVAGGLATAEGRGLLRGLNFNRHSALDSILRKACFVDTNTGTITIKDLAPITDLAYPPGTTHVQFKGAFLKIDFATQARELRLTNTVLISLNKQSSDIVLTPPSLPGTESGISIFVLGIDFFQEINGMQYALQDGAYNAAKIVEVS